jgi:hypothetical protein
MHAADRHANMYFAADAVAPQGTTNITYGLTPAPCRECPANMLAENSDAYPASKRFFRRNADGTGGFTDPAACVTLPGGS